MFNKKRVFEILDAAHDGDIVSRITDLVILTLIGLSTCVVVLESVESINTGWAPLFWCVEVISITVFSVEYLLRLWCCTANPRYKSRWHFALSPMGLIDVLAIAPFFIPGSVLDLRFVRALRLIRLLRLAKAARYPTVLGTFGRVLRSKREELLATLAMVFLVLLVTSGAMYFAENDAQPAAFSSIPAAMWWGIATLTTVGYGDVTPVTNFGRVLGAFVAVLGVGIFAFPTGILGAGFLEEVEAKKIRSRGVCPLCGEARLTNTVPPEDLPHDAAYNKPHEGPEKARYTNPWRR